MAELRNIQLLFIPVIQNSDQLNDIISRAAWHFYYSKIDKIILPVASEELLYHQPCVPDNLDPSIAERFEKIKNKAVLKILSSKKDLIKAINDSDIILQWKENIPFGLSYEELGNLKKGKKYWQVDSHNTRLEGSYYIEASFFSFQDKKELIEGSKSKFELLSKGLENTSRANILTTGPSVSDYKKNDLNNALNIICNTLILDEELMNNVNPDILVFADPIFQFGVSRYAYNFRTALIRALHEYDFYVVVPLKYYPLALSFLHEFKERVIGVPYDKDYRINLDLEREFYLKGTPNILTFLMIPLATTFAQEINFLGCDGRMLCNDQYFWSHNPSTQQSKVEMENIKEVHPGFFKTDYNVYYLEHCIMLEKYLRTGEEAGFRFYSLAPSYIPALRLRQFSGTSVPDNEKLPEEKAGRVLIIDPDGESTIGHYLAYNDNMQKALEDLGAEVDVLCNKNMDPDVLKDRNNYHPELRVKSYYVSVDKNKQAYIPKANSELKTFLSKYVQKHKKEIITIYMYVGSFEHFSMIYNAIGDNNNVRIVINLYRLSFVDLNKEYINAWKDHLVKCMDNNGRFVLTVPTKELQTELYNLCDYILPIAPHPSTTFSDEDFPALHLQVESRVGNKNSILKVLFLGLPRYEKGYENSLQVVRCLSKYHEEYSCSLRHIDWQGTPTNLKRYPEDLQNKCNLILGTIDLEIFKKYFLEHDVGVIPYDPSSFKNRTSGLLIDSIYAGLPVVCVDGTWLGRIVTEYGCGVVVDDLKPDKLIQAIQYIKNNYYHFADKALKASINYFCKNNWSILARSVLPFDEGSNYYMIKQVKQRDKSFEEYFEINQENKKIIIIGNGPSSARLAEYGFHNIPEHIDTFGMVCAYRYFEKIDWWPTYYGLADKKVAYYHRNKFAQLIEDYNIPTKKFFMSWKVSESPKLEVIEHSSTGSFCLRKAIELGYDEIYLIGMEGVYVEEIAQSRPLSEKEFITYGFDELNLSPKEKKLRIITSTPSYNPNYFFSDYQRVGDVYSLPQSNTHQKNWSRVASEASYKGIKIFNLSDQSSIEEFDKMDFDTFISRINPSSRYQNRYAIRDGQEFRCSGKDSENKEFNLNFLPITQFLKPVTSKLVGPFDRIKQANLEETEIIASYFYERSSGSVIIDVGSYHGASFTSFLKRGWQVFAFEPDLENARILKEKLKKRDNASLVRLDTRAVSNKNMHDLNLYRSEESSGLSGLTPFHQTHKPVHKVDTVTLREALKKHDISSVDFLKIDTEGHEMFVLKGFPWERFMPRVIECEFEDYKTVPLGYTWVDLAEFLVHKGYHVYVSEWYPIILYGINHDWRQLLRYPCKLSSEKAWGNLLAFREPVEEDYLIGLINNRLIVTPNVHKIEADDL